MQGIFIGILFGIMLWLFKEGWMFLTVFPATAICYSIKQSQDVMSVDRFFTTLICFTFLVTGIGLLKSLLY